MARLPLGLLAALLAFTICSPAGGADDARASQELAPAEALVAAWDFQGALKALEKLKPGDAGLAASVAARRDEVQRLAKLKARMIARINEAQPRLRKSSLLIRGINGDLTKADDRAIIASLPNGKDEEHLWGSLAGRSVERLVGLVANKDSAEDCVAGALLALVAKDSATAEGLLEKAKSLGAQIDRYLDPLAASAFDRARDLIANKKLAEARADLEGIEKRYGKTAWFAAHKQDLDAAKARAEATAAQEEAKKGSEQAEKLYAEAARLYKRKELFDLKPVIDKLKADFLDTPAVTDAARSPSFDEMRKAVEKVGKFLTVRRVGKADHQRIQDAINAAPPYSVIEIQDDGPFNEKLVVPQEKAGLTLRGWKHGWPVLTSVGKTGAFDVLLDIAAADTTVERLTLAHQACNSDWGSALRVARGPCRMRSLVVCMNATTNWWTLTLGDGAGYEIENCAVAGTGKSGGEIALKDSVWLNCHDHGGLFAWGGLKAENSILVILHVSKAADLRNCTVTKGTTLTDQPCVAVDCIFQRVECAKPGAQIDFCDVYPGGYLVAAKAGKKCFSADPRFVDPKGLDYRLAPGSPCRKKASDGGDIGCRYTPEMVELVKKCLDLRKRGTIAF
ncbi:MAG: hypothetical protein FJ291_20310 [Planctomycetes bacterium]|nr:hypothetical protein [Planctomycetota bacterium]